MADLKEQVLEAEEGARDKAEELSEAVARLRQFEAGEVGLTEVSAECAALRRQVKARDARVEELIKQADGLQLQAGEAVEENRELRERLGMQPRAGEEKKSSVERRGRGGGGEGRGQEERALVTVLQRELDRLEEERLALKTENRKLAQQCGARAAKLGLEPGLDNAEDVDDDGVLTDILADNLNQDKNAERDSNDDDHVLISGDLEALQEYGEALRRRRQAMGGRQDEVIKQHEGNVMMQKDLEAAREEVARMGKEAGKASQREEELKGEVEKLRQSMHQILESVREQVCAWH